MTDKTCISPLATRPVLYTDTVGGKQTCRDDLWAVTTDELNALTRQAAPEAPTLPQHIERDWIEDAHHENGNYQCKCSTCGNTFIGYKRRVTCKACAAATTASASDGLIYESVSRRADPVGHAEAAAQMDELLGCAPAPSRDAALRPALEGLLNRYVELVSSGDAGNWDPEAEAQVIAARAALTQQRALTQQSAAQAPTANAERDAARYRWLRDKSELGICAFYLSVGQAFKGVKFTPETVDAALDDAIEKEKA